MILSAKTPKHRPHGHKHLLWTRMNNHLYCWGCDREYFVSECCDLEEVDGAVGEGADRE